MNTLINNYKCQNLNFNSLIVFKTNQISKKFDYKGLKEYMILESYERLYDEVISKINEILIVFQNNSISEIVSLYNEKTFISLITKVSLIKNNLLIHFNSEKLPKVVSIFIDSYIKNAYSMLNSFRFMISYISEYDSKANCCEILSSLDSIKEYIKKVYSNDGCTLAPVAIAEIPLILKEPYNTYIILHGLPGESGFNPELLADIALSLGL